MHSDYRSSLKVSEYLDQINEVDSRNFVGQALQEACKMLPAINKMLGKDQELAEIRIVVDAVPNAEAISWVIRINSGLIDHCLKFARDKDINRDLPSWATPHVLASAALSWVLAHEWTHVVRSHDDVCLELGSDYDISQALEQDADFCAVAAIYRSLQAKFSVLTDDLEIRKLVIHCIFWTIRSLPSQSNSHAGIASRIANAIIKLSTLSINKFELPDCSGERDETIMISTALAQVLTSAEKYYQTRALDVDKKSDLLKRVVQEFKDGSAGRPTSTWVKISPVVERLSTTRAVSPLKNND